jgi:hypothetical protein
MKKKSVNKRNIAIKVLILLIILLISIVITIKIVFFSCPFSCDDGNPCTLDYCSAETDYRCEHKEKDNCCINHNQCSDNKLCCNNQCIKPKCVSNIECISENELEQGFCKYQNTCKSECYFERNLKKYENELFSVLYPKEYDINVLNEVIDTIYIKENNERIDIKNILGIVNYEKPRETQSYIQYVEEEFGVRIRYSNFNRYSNELNNYMRDDFPIFNDRIVERLSYEKINTNNIQVEKIVFISQNPFYSSYRFTVTGRTQKLETLYIIVDFQFKIDNEYWGIACIAEKYKFDITYASICNFIADSFVLKKTGNKVMDLANRGNQESIKNTEENQEASYLPSTQNSPMPIDNSVDVWVQEASYTSSSSTEPCKPPNFGPAWDKYAPEGWCK